MPLTRITLCEEMSDAHLQQLSALYHQTLVEVFEVPLTFILDPDNPKRHSREFMGGQRHFYVFPYQQRYIWGATAGMLVNLRDVLREAP